MKYVQFKTLKIQNFLSIGEEPVTITFERGINIIAGLNKDSDDRRNAAGKSTIANALFFSIFGDTMHGLKRDRITNYITGGTCAVELTFSVQEINSVQDYTIVRTINPNKCYLFENGIDVTRDSMANTTRYICDILDASPELFKNCVIMTLNDTIPFMMQSKAEKRALIENIFNLQVFADMATQVKEDLAEAKKAHELELYKSNETATNIKRLKDQRDIINKTRSVKIADLRKRIDANQVNITALEKKKNSIIQTDNSSLEADIKKAENVLSTTNSSIDLLTSGIANHEATIKSSRDALQSLNGENAVCPACTQPISEDTKHGICVERNRIHALVEQHKKELVESVEKLKELKSTRDMLNRFIVKCKEDAHAASIQTINRESIQKEINSIEAWNDLAREEIAEATNTATDVDPSINELTAKLENININIQTILKTVNKLSKMRVVVSDEGVKTFITKRILQSLNNKIKIYLQKMGCKYSCTFDEFFDEDLRNEFGKVCSYYNFSGAERKSIDFACLFAFLDVRRTQGCVSYNVVFYDELFDTSLDDKGVELVHQIITERARELNECAYIITHRKSSSFFATSKIINLVKENGITRRVD